MGHVLTIDSEEAFALATKLADRHGESLEAIVSQALRDRMQADERDLWIANIRQKAAEFRASLNEPHPSLDSDFLYNLETGLPA